MCDLSQVALKGYLAAQSLTQDQLLPELLLQKQQEIREGHDSETAICNYVDFLMSTQNPCNTDDWAKPALHPCKREFQDVTKDVWDKDYEDLLNLVKRHTQCSTAYCLRKQQQEDEASCRFNFPKESCDKTHLQYEKLKSKGRRSSNLTTILMKRTRLLNFRKDMFRQLLCHRQLTDRITIMNNI